MRPALKALKTSMMSERQKLQLQVLKDIYEVSCSCSTKTWIWGGLVIDILEGHFIREHNDIDCFSLNLLDVKNGMDTLFKQRGYATEYLSDVDMFKIDLHGCHAAFNRLEIDKDVAMWRHIGNEGTLFFPMAWLNKSPFSFYDIPTLVSGIEFEYVIKAKVKLLSPIWDLREKDTEALEYWTQKLRLGNVPLDELLKQVWSDNPYWRRLGYQD